MTISGQSGTSLLESVLKSESTRVDAQVVLLDKAQDITRQQGEAMVQLLEAAGPDQSGLRLDAYA